MSERLVQGTFECDICGRTTPHHHDQELVEIERLIRPAFERTTVPRNSFGRFPKKPGVPYDRETEALWQHFLSGWYAHKKVFAAQPSEAATVRGEMRLSKEQLIEEWYAVHTNTGLDYLRTPQAVWFERYAERLNRLLVAQPLTPNAGDVRLRKLSEKATPGPWKLEFLDGYITGHITSPKHNYCGNSAGRKDSITAQDSMTISDGEFIVACVDYVRRALAASTPAGPPAPSGELGYVTSVPDPQHRTIAGGMAQNIVWEHESRETELREALRFLLDNRHIPAPIWCNGPDDSDGVNCTACKAMTLKAGETLSHKPDCKWLQVEAALAPDKPQPPSEDPSLKETKLMAEQSAKYWNPDQLHPTMESFQITEKVMSRAGGNSMPPVCQKHNEQTVLSFFERPGGLPGNNWVCRSCIAERQNDSKEKQ